MTFVSANNMLENSLTSLKGTSFNIGLLSYGKNLMEWLFFSPPFSLEKEILDRYLEVVLKGNKDGLKVRSESLVQ